MSGSRRGDEGVEVKMVRRVVRPEEPPKVANRFFFTAVGLEIQLDVCFADLHEVREELEKAKRGEDPKILELLVFERFQLSPNAAWDLLQTAQRIVAHLKQAGGLPRDVPPTDPN